LYCSKFTIIFSLSLSRRSLCFFLFLFPLSDPYPEPCGRYLDHEEIEKIVKDLYGKRNFKKSAQAQKCVRQLKAMEWYSSTSSDSADSVAAGGEIDFKAFHLFSKNHPSLLYPAFMMQYDLQARVLGSGFWQCAAAQRKELETITAGNGSDNDLIGALQQMHALEEEYAMHAAGSENFEENGLSFFTHHADDDDDFQSTPSNPSIPNNLSISSMHSKTNVNSKRSKTTSLRSKYIIGNKKKGKKSNPYSAKKADSPNKSKEKEQLKAKIKKEMRATRRAKQTGTNPEKAKKRASEKFEQEMKSQRKREQKAKPMRIRKDVGLSQKDGSMAWQCQRCHHANYAAELCATCGHRRGIFDAQKMVPLSPKRKIRRKPTFG